MISDRQQFTFQIAGSSVRKDEDGSPNIGARVRLRDGKEREALVQGVSWETLLAQWRGRHLGDVEGWLEQARFPWMKALKQFDSSFQPRIDCRVIQQLDDPGFVDMAENIVFLCPPGVGKTHLAIAPGGKAIELGYKVLFFTLGSLLSRLMGGNRENRLEREL